MQNMITALARQITTVRTAKYGVSEETVPKTAGTFLDRGILFASRSDYETAILDFTEALRLDPDLSGAYLLWGRALFANVSKVTKTESNFSNVIVIVNERSNTEKIRLYEQAIGDFTQAIRLDPNNSIIYRERGRAYSIIGDYDRTITDYDIAIQLDASDFLASNNRGIAYYEKKDYNRAIADYETPLRIDPSNSDIKTFLEHVRHQQRK
jgi:tetratricopeptide (TPR) repeat protein